MAPVRRRVIAGSGSVASGGSRAQLLQWLERHSNQHERPLTDRWFDRDGRLRALPTQRAKRRAVLLRLVERLEPGRRYKETELNAVLREVFDDVAYVRREIAAEQLVTRHRGVYERAG